MVRPVTMDEVVETPTIRFSTLIPELDHVFGCSRRYSENRKVIGETWGIARGKLWVFGGPEGIGKTRFYTMVAIILAEFAGMRILVFQKEMTAGEYKEVLMNSYRSLNIKPLHLSNIFFESTKVLSRQVEMIRGISPDLVIDDSFNLTTEPNAKTEKGIQQIVTEWKAAAGNHTALWMIAHMNNEGKIKGNNHLSYMVDAIFFLEHATTPETRYEEAHPEVCRKRFTLRSAKSRQGESDLKVYLRHRNDHSEVISDAERLRTGAVEHVDEADVVDLSSLSFEDWWKAVKRKR